MKKLIIGAMCLALLSVTGTALAVDDATITQIQNDAANAKNKSNNNDGKITGLYDNVVNLQNQIDNIQLTPGADGAPGADGRDGRDGRDGLTGPAGEPIEGLLNLLCSMCEINILTCPVELPCTTGYKIVFVTSERYPGNLTTGVGGSGSGKRGADEKCNFLAESAGLPGVYKAWLSDSTSSVKTDVNFKKLYLADNYLLVDGTLVAENWYDLTDGTLWNPINLDELGDFQSGQVWTGTLASGESPVYPHPDQNECRNWTDSTLANRTGLMSIGDSEKSDSGWSSVGGDESIDVFCDEEFRLYCFEQ